MKPLVIYHDNCADGFGAAFAAWLKFGDEAEYYADQYGKQDAPWRQDENLDLWEIYILDFSYPKEDMDYLFKVAKRVVWLDHHKTAFEVWCGGIPDNGVYENVLNYSDAKDYIRLDNNRSGAMLAWEYFHRDKEVPMLIKHIDDYDRWQFKLEGTKEFSRALWSYAPWSFEQWRDINLCVEENYLAVSESIADKYEYGRMLIEGAAILRAHDANVRAVVEGAGRKCKITIHETDPGFGHPSIDLVLEGLAANCPAHLASDVGHELAIQSGTYGLLWYINKDGKCKCSIRSNGDYDVSAIAKAFGGGGHRNAAGFEVDIQTLLSWIS